MLKFESRDAPRDVCGGVELGQLLEKGKGQKPEGKELVILLM